MSNQGAAPVFAGSIPAIYESHLVPLIFEPYARDLADAVAAHPLNHVLEIAAGTGVLTRALDDVLPGGVGITATDLSQSMLDQAAQRPTRRPVQWRQADAMSLPFDDETFDAVVCQFGVMFFPDRPQAYAQARRVLRRGGLFVFNVWDSIEKNVFADVVTQALEQVFPQDPPRFMARIPHGYHDRELVVRELAQAGFNTPPKIATIAARSRAASARIAAIAYCQGTPLRNEIEARDAARLAEATERAAQAIAERFGRGAVDGKIQAHRFIVAR